jgi:hypothetical protein
MPAISDAFGLALFEEQAVAGETYGLRHHGG